MGRRRVRRALKRMVLVAVILIVGGVVALAFFSRKEPQWYAPPDPANEVVKVVADRAEFNVIAQAQKVRPPDEPWAMEVDESQINSWLSARLPAWLALEQNAEWPEQLGTPQVRLSTDTIMVAIPVDLPFGTRVVVADLQPLAHDGALWLHLHSVSLGTMPIPGDPVDTLLSLIGDALGPFADPNDTNMQNVIDVLTGKTPLDAVFKLSDTREVHVLDAQCRDGMLGLTNTTSGPRGR